ncbi:glycosyltransferase family 2 protein, partial [Escherichia coli]|nr:glycosyltransferase family 2 protein [Escherichia coli]
NTTHCKNNILNVTQKETVTLVIPCFNEEESIPFLVNTLRQLRDLLSENGYNLEVIFVDDCSTDSTPGMLRQTYGDDPLVRIIRHENNRGVAAAIMTGIRASNSEVVCSIDCDCTYDPYEVVPMLKRFGPEVDMIT